VGRYKDPAASERIVASVGDVVEDLVWHCEESPWEALKMSRNKARLDRGYKLRL
jgi:hypothetical protein